MAANVVRVVRTKGVSILRQLRLEVGRGAGGQDRPWWAEEEKVERRSPRLFLL